MGIPRRRTQFSQYPPQILNVLVQLKNSGKTDNTIKNLNKSLVRIAKNANLDDPQSVLNYIANKQATNNTKEALCYAYRKYCKYYNIHANIPFYKPQSKPIKIPTKEKLEMLIARASKQLATKLQLSMETGLRPIELINLKVKDLDLDQNLVYPTTAKHGSARTLKISNRLKGMIEQHIAKHRLQPNDQLFKSTPSNYGKQFRAMRTRFANKLSDPTIHNIRLYDFRHYFATNLYHKTRDILLVKQQMGHTRIETTLIYTQLLNLNDDEWTCKTAKNPNEISQLIEAGFEYVTELDGLKFFKKRK